MKIKGTLILTLVSLLERLSYYGVRAILVLYAIDSNVLDVEQNQVIAFYGYWAMALAIGEIPLSFITDKILGQRKSIYLGGILSLIGYLLLMIPNQNILFVSLILIFIGTGFVKPSTTILIGRQFKKEDKGRTLAYMIFFTGVNIGVFLGVLGIGYLGEAHNWKLGFLVAAISTLAYLLIVFFLRSKIIETETNDLLFSDLRITFKRSALILPLLILIYVVFWKSYELETSELIFSISNSGDNTIFGSEIFRSILHDFSTIWTIPFTIFIFIYWYFKGVTNVFKAITISMLALITAVIISFILQNVEVKYLLEVSMIPLALFALSEVIISPILTSYVTRIADVKYSNTIYSTFFFICLVLGIGFNYLLENEFHFYIAIAMLLSTVVGINLWRNQISKLTCELE